MSKPKAKKETQKKPKQNNKRPSFNYDGDSDLEIRAGGLIYYRIVDHNPEFLMIKSRGRYEDFGGCTDLKDTCIEDTVAREACEESNEIFERDVVFDEIKKTCGTYYPKSKYVVYLVKTDIDYNVNDFGDKELHDNIERTVEWVPYSSLKNKEFIRNKLHFRLMFYHFFAAIDRIYKDTNNG